jgi:hypothetical protein
MDYRRRLKRLYTVLTVCWIGVCSIGGFALSPAGGSGIFRGPSQARAVAREWTGYTRDLLKDLSGPEYAVIRQSAFFHDLTSILMQASHSVSSSTDELIAETKFRDGPEGFGALAGLRTASKTDAMAWLAITASPPILVYVIGFIAVPRIVGGFKSREYSPPR